jgi:hypothetical protein
MEPQDADLLLGTELAACFLFHVVVWLPPPPIASLLTPVRSFRLRQNSGFGPTLLVAVLFLISGTVFLIEKAESKKQKKLVGIALIVGGLLMLLGLFL